MQSNLACLGIVVVFFLGGGILSFTVAIDLFELVEEF